MTKTILFHSFFHGVGRSNVAANVAFLLANQGKRIAIIDTDTKAPALNLLFGLQEDQITYTFNDYLWGVCGITETAHKIIGLTDTELEGEIYLTPGNTLDGNPPRELTTAKDAELLNAGCQTLAQAYNLDAILIDTHPGISEKSLVSITVADALGIILRLNKGDYQGTSVTVEIVRRLNIPQIVLIVNEAPATYDFDEIRIEVSKTYGCEVASVLPYADEMMALGNKELFALRYPNHSMTKSLQYVAEALIAPLP